MNLETYNIRNKEYQNRLVKSLIFILIGFISLILVIYVVSADSIGYEFLDNDTLYVYNNGTPSDWFYFGSCGNNLLNNVNNSWEVISMLGAYGNNLDQAFNSKREFTPNECERTVKSDNLTYVNVTFTNNIQFQGRDVRYRKEGYIELNDDYMREKFSAKNTGNPPINFPLWFFLERHNISISETFNDDIFAVPLLNGSKEYYQINENNTDKRFNGSKYMKGFFLIDQFTEEHISFVHDHDNEWYHIIDNKSVYSVFRVADSLSRDESIIIDTWFQDATKCGCLFGSYVSVLGTCPDAGGCNASIGSSFNMQCKQTLLMGSCTGCANRFEYNNGLAWFIIPANPTSAPFDCNGVVCYYNDNYNVWVNKRINCNSFYSGLTRCRSVISGSNIFQLNAYCYIPPVVPEETKPDPLPPVLQYREDNNYIWLGFILLITVVLGMFFWGGKND